MKSISINKTFLNDTPPRLCLKLFFKPQTMISAPYWVMIAFENERQNGVEFPSVFYGMIITPSVRLKGSQGKYCKTWNV